MPSAVSPSTLTGAFRRFATTVGSSAQDRPCHPGGESAEPSEVTSNACAFISGTEFQRVLSVYVPHDLTIYAPNPARAEILEVTATPRKPRALYAVKSPQVRDDKEKDLCGRYMYTVTERGCPEDTSEAFRALGVATAGSADSFTWTHVSVTERPESDPSSIRRLSGHIIFT